MALSSRYLGAVTVFACSAAFAVGAQASVESEAGPKTPLVVHGASSAHDRLTTDYATALASRLAVENKVVGGEPIDLDRLRRFYAERGFVPAWLRDTPEAGLKFSAAAGVAAQTLQAAADEGLLPQSYHADALAALAAPKEDASPEAIEERRLALELLLTDGLLRYARDVRSGRLPPRKISYDLGVEPPVIDAAAAVGAIASADDPAAALAALSPKNADYQRLRQALAELRRVARAGGWPMVPPFKGKSKLEPGASDPAVPALRDRLAASGDYAGPRGGGAKAQTYDPALRAAVIRFQSRHGLEPDGVLGPTALAELNTTVDARMAQVVANMERARWLPDNFGDRYVKVNVPEYKLTAFDNGVAVRTMRVIVGTPKRKTPMLSATINTVILNPTWTMPPRLVKEDYLPKLQKNPGYLAENGFSVYANWDSRTKPLDVRKINWKSFSPAAASHLKLKQEPGPKNALGQIKFNIENDYDVYLHDTPSRDKFQRSMRALSSGCVRLGEPMALADYVFADMPEWGAEQRKPVLESLKTRFVPLKRPTSVHILYQTAWVDDSGALNIRPDIYDRDAELLNAVARVAPTNSTAIRTAMGRN